MLHHYITKYKDENGDRKAVAWIQLSIFGWCWCFSKREIDL